MIELAIVLSIPARTPIGNGIVRSAFLLRGLRAAIQSSDCAVRAEAGGCDGLSTESCERAADP
jgi:hypothetical protein